MNLLEKEKYKNYPRILLGDSFKDNLNERNLKFNGFTELNNGINSKVFRVNCNSCSFILKEYPLHPHQEHDRMNTEIRILKYMESINIDKVPRYLFSDKESNWAAYTLLKGDKIYNVSNDLVRDVFKFMDLINRCDNNRDLDFIPKAKESCFSIKEHVSTISNRFKHIEIIKGNSMIHDKAYLWIEKSLKPIFEKQSNQVLRLSISENDCSCSINSEDILISPSDVGIHNMLIYNDIYYYLDFEYAGFDDVVKFAIDWIIQPENIFETKLALNFLNNIDSLVKSTNWRKRFDLLIDIYAIKWSLIILNPFLYPSKVRKENDLEKCLQKSQLYFNRVQRFICEIKESKK